jgi:23S rRNA (cytosine1962-C5)-methyltransferase
LFRDFFSRAVGRRGAARSQSDAWRAFGGAADGMPGVYVDVYGPGAVLIVYEGVAPRGFDTAAAAGDVLAVLAPSGVRAVYLKPFVKDRSRLGGALPEVATSPAPAAGESLPESLVVSEHELKLEVRLYDGLSTGLFLDQRENRAWVASWVKERAARSTTPAVLNTFAYTCAFSVAAAAAGATTASVDVSPRYLDWGKRNLAHNGLDPAAHRFAKMDTFEFLGYAKRKQLWYDLVILDPPSFAAGSKKKGIRPWSSVADYGRLVKESAGVLNAGGAIFASTNTQELCRPGRLEREIVKALGRTPRWLRLPPLPADFAGEKDRFAARAFVP